MRVVDGPYHPRKWEGKFQKAQLARDLWLRGLTYHEVGVSLGKSREQARTLGCWLYRYERALVWKIAAEPWQQTRVLRACAGNLAWVGSKRKDLPRADFFRGMAYQLKELTELYPDWSEVLGRALVIYEELYLSLPRGQRPEVLVEELQNELLRMARFVMGELVT